MLKKPYKGAAGIHFFDIDIEFFTDWEYGSDNAPIHWLKACKFGLEHDLPVTLAFLGDGDIHAEVIADEDRTSVWFVGEDTFYVYEGYGKMNLTEDIVTDINRDFDAWIEEWYDYEIWGLRDLSQEDINFRNKRLGAEGFFWRNERVELRLKTALREAESAWLRRKWK